MRNIRAFVTMTMHEWTQMPGYEWFSVAVTSQLGDVIFLHNALILSGWSGCQDNAAQHLSPRPCCSPFARFIKEHYWWITPHCPFLLSLYIFQMEPDYILASNHKSSKNAPFFILTQPRAWLCSKPVLCACATSGTWSTLRITLPSQSEAA